MTREPARITAVIVASLEAIFGVAVAFGLGLSDGQQTAILGAVAPCVALTLFVGEVIRRRVTPVAKARDRIERAYTAGGRGTPKPTL